LTASSLAGTESKEVKSVVEKVKESCISGDLGVNFVSAYFSRGILQENQGVIAQPWINIYFKLYEGDGFINKINLILGVWSSIHSEETGAIPGSTTSSWYEFDYTPGIAITFAKNWTLTTSYFEFTYPNDAFGLAPQRSINTVLALDDSEWLGAFALKPHVTALYNFDGIAGLGQTDAWYFEFGIAPGFKAGPISFTIPLTVGFGDENFYPGDSYGYFSAGLNASLPLAFIPECFGAWTLNGGATYYNLGSATAAVNQDQDENAFVFSGGLSIAF
jgi:hypothetical protein